MKSQGTDIGKVNITVILTFPMSVVVTLKSQGTDIGKVNITVRAIIDNSVEGCTKVPESVEGFTDTLVKPLLVKPEGFPVEKVESDFKCIEDKQRDSFTLPELKLPSNLVKRSERAWVEITGDIMAPALENVGNLVRLPTGCGEQNMVGLVPNIYLLQYLNSTKQPSKELERKAKNYMEIGYTRQQKYNHPNGAYSIWGDKGEKDGSSWLTAFVVKSFSEASQYIQIEDSLVQRSVDWLLKSQNENGCFQKLGYTHSSYLKGGNSDSSLTPFIVTALVKARARLDVKIPIDKLIEGVDCMLKVYNSSDLYSTIVTAHAATVVTMEAKDAKSSEKLSEMKGKVATWEKKS